MKKISLLFIWLAAWQVKAQQVGINTTTVNNSAVLQVESTTKGLLIPHLTTTARLAINTASPAPATSLMVYDTDTKTFWYFNSTVWVELKDSYSNGDIGVIAAFQGTVPAGWLALNGSSVTVAAYPGLAAKYTTWVSGANIVLPDYRGYFLRGNGANADGLATGSTPGAKQVQNTALPASGLSLGVDGDHTHTATFGADGDHTHNYTDANAGNAWHHSNGGSIASATRSWTDVTRTTDAAGAHFHTFTTAASGTHMHAFTGGDTETKPTNITITWAVKAR